MQIKECKFPQQWQKFETREEALAFVRGKLMEEKRYKKFLEIKADFEARNGDEMGGIFFRWADQDVYWWGESVLREILADVNAYFDDKEIVDKIENPINELAKQYLLQEKQNALKAWRKSVREIGKTPTKKQTENKIAEIDAWAKDVLPLCVEKIKLRYAKAKGRDELEKTDLEKRLRETLQKLKEKDIVEFKKKLVVDVLYFRYKDRLKAIEEKYSAKNLCLPKFKGRVQEVSLDRQCLK